MWSCRSIKKEGWNRLKKHLGGALLITLLLFIILLLTQIPSELSNIQREQNLALISTVQASGSVTTSDNNKIMGGAVTQIVWAIVCILVFLLVYNPIMVGYTRWFISNSHEEGTPRISMLFYSFQSGIYKRIVGGTFYRSLWLYIWQYAASLFYIPFYISFYFTIYSIIFSVEKFIVPKDLQEFFQYFYYYGYKFSLPLLLFFIGSIGYIAILANRMYAYSFVNFILADNPAIGTKNAMNRSKQMTYGMKKKLLLLDLSYIGWWILTILTLGLLSFGLLPYITQTRSELYMKRKTENRLF